MSEIIVGLGAVIAAALAGFLAARPRLTKAPRARPPQGRPPLGLGVELDDVVVLRTLEDEGKERWLEGALVGLEGTRARGALFVCPDAGPLVAVGALASTSAIYWLEAVDLELPSDTPLTIDRPEGILRRAARWPVTFERRGRGAPDLGDEGVIALYEGGGSRAALLFKGSRGSAMYVGQNRPREAFEIWGRGSGEGGAGA